MKNEKVKLLRAIFGFLNLDEVPSSMVSRRLAIFKAFEENKQAFLEPEFLSLFWKVQGKVKATLTPTISPSIIYSFVNENQDLWEEARKTEVIEKESQVAVSFELSEDFKKIVESS